MNTMNNRWAIAIVLLLVVALGAVFYFREGSVSNTTNTPVVTNRPLKTFYNQKYGIALNYPDNYKVEERDLSGAGTPHHTIVIADAAALANVPADSEGPPSITIDVYDNTAKDTVEKWVKGSNFSNFKLSPDQTLVTTSVAGQEAVAYGWDGLYRSASIVFPYANRIYMLSVGYNAPTDQLYKDFATIVSSIQLDP